MKLNISFSIAEEKLLKKVKSGIKSATLLINFFEQIILKMENI